MVCCAPEYVTPLAACQRNAAGPVHVRIPRFVFVLRDISGHAMYPPGRIVEFCPPCQERTRGIWSCARWGTFALWPGGLESARLSDAGRCASPQGRSMEIVVNGQTTAGNFTTAQQLLEARGLDPRLVVVELNGKILPAADFASQPLKDGDTVEIVQFVAGG